MAIEKPNNWCVMSEVMSSLPLQCCTKFCWPGPNRSPVVLVFDSGKKLQLSESSQEGAVTSVELPIGVHRYLFFVDGELRPDPLNTMPLIDGFNQIEVLPVLPACVPLTLKGHSLGHLLLQFSSSVLDETVSFLHSRGLKGILISVMLLDLGYFAVPQPNKVNACALLRHGNDNSEEIQTENELNQYMKKNAVDCEKYQLVVTRFQKHQPRQFKSEAVSPSKKKMVIISDLPDYIIDQHILEHFGYFSSEIKAVTKCPIQKKFSILFFTATIAKEAAGAYNNTILKGNRIQVILEDVSYEESNDDQSRHSSDLDLFSFDMKSTPFSGVCDVDFREHGEAASLTELSGESSIPVTDTESINSECSETESSGLNQFKQEIKVFIYSRPKFSGSVKKEHLMEHFRKFDPIHAYVIKNKTTRKPGNTGVVVLSSKTMAEEVIRKMGNSKILGKYLITLKPEDPSPISDRGKALKSETPNAIRGAHHKRECSAASIDTAKHSSFSAVVNVSRETEGAKKVEDFCSVEIKVSHLARETTVRDLRQFFEKFGPLDGNPILHARGRPPYAFVKFKSSESASRAVSTNNPKLRGCCIKTKFLYKEVDGRMSVHTQHKVKKSMSQTEIKSSKPPAEMKTFTKTLMLESTEWNMLMTKWPKMVTISSFSTLLELIRSSYCSEDLAYNASVENSCLEIKGKRHLVQQFCEDIEAVSTYGDLLIDGLIMKALVYLRRSLPAEINESFHVVISGFECTSNRVQFFGPIEGMRKAHTKVLELVAKLHKSENKLELQGKFSEDQLQLLQEKLSTKCFLRLSSHSKDVLVIYALESLDTDDIIKLANSMLTASKILDLQPSQVTYLQHFWLPHQKDTPATVSITDNKVQLHGTPEALKASERLLRLEVLPHVKCDLFSYTCRDVFVSQIEKFVLDEIKNEDESFKSSCNYDSIGQNITVIISSKNEWFFSKASKELKKLEPQFKEYSVGLPPDFPLKKQLEQKYRTVINCLARELVQICGLIAPNIEECYKELVDKLESSESKTESIPISKCQYHYFTKFHDKDIKEFNQVCKVDLFFSKEEKKYSIEISGAVKQVKMVEEKLRTNLLAQKLIALPFTLSCPSNLSSHWCELWNKISAKKMNTIPNFYMVFNQSHCESGMDFFNFDLIGRESESAYIQEVKDLIYYDGYGTRTVENPVTFSENGMITFLKYRVGQNFPFIRDSDVWISGIDNATVKLSAPMRLANNLTGAVAKLKTYILTNTATSEVIEVQDPVVQLVLSSSKHRESYLKNAQIEAEVFDANVELSTTKNGTKCFLISASEYSISSSIAAVKKVTIDAIKGNITQKMIAFEFMFRPLIDASSNFKEIAKKLENEHCAVCSLKSENVPLYTLHYQNTESTEGNILKINVVQGCQVLEEADAMVNFTGEDPNLENDMYPLVVECAGPTVRTEYSDYAQSVHWQLNIRDAICLGAGDLPCKSVIHSILPDWNGENLELVDLNTAFVKILEIADVNSLKHISIPLGCSDTAGCEIMYAETLLEVIKDHHKELPSTSSLCEISVVAKKETSAHAFVDAITSHTSITVVEKYPKCRHAKELERKLEYKWSWRNDHKMYSPYDSNQNVELSLAYNQNPKGFCTISINSVQYTIDFESMKQRNDKTLFERKVKKEPVVVEEELNQIAEWKYQADDGTFVAYSEGNSTAIEKMFLGISEDRRLLINFKQYQIDFTTMSQINVISGFKRKIQRDAEKIKAEKDTNGTLDSFTVSIRGLEEELPMAEKALVDDMNDCIQSETMGNIPADLPKELKDEFEGLASKNSVMAEWTDSSDEDSCQSLTLRGVHYRVQKTYIAIHKELCKFKSLEKPGQDYSVSRPSLWEPQTSDVDVFHVSKESDEWKEVEIKFMATMPMHTITEIQRIQNELIWKRYSLHKKYMEDKNKGTVNEIDLFHGSCENNPEEIYGGECGFDMRYSRKGMWGHANYFAVNASYSHKYAYTGHRLHYSFLSRSISSTRQIFLAKVLIGEHIKLEPNNNLIMPPLKTGFTKKQYDSITGYTNGSDVYMTYDNDKAYPAYLIVYQ